MRNFEKAKRVVIKIGTNTLSTVAGIDCEYIRNIAGQIAELRKQNKQVLIVSSGAVGLGAKSLALGGPVTDVRMRQACAALGQPLLMREYDKAFAVHDIKVAQVLLTSLVLNNRTTYLNLRNAIETLLALNVLPILNENDCVATDEINLAFGDNDKLSARVASKIDADLLILLTDIDSLYDKNPKEYPDAKPIKIVEEITSAITNAAGKAGSLHSTGGMKTKIQAAKIASTAGCRMLLAHGRADNVLPRIIAGEDIGTLFIPQAKLSNRRRWILHTDPEGTITIDEGAVNALRSHKSLLPSGVTAITGSFAAGAVVMINDIAKAVTSLSSAELQKVAGQHSSKIREILGPNRKDVIATPEDIIQLEVNE